MSFNHYLYVIIFRWIIINSESYLQDNNAGQALLDVVFRHLDLLETAYFGLRYVDQENQTVSTWYCNMLGLFYKFIFILRKAKESEL